MRPSCALTALAAMLFASGACPAQSSLSLYGSGVTLGLMQKF